MEASQRQLKQDQRTHRPNELNLWLLHLSYVEFFQQVHEQPELTRQHKIKLLSEWEMHKLFYHYEDKMISSRTKKKNIKSMDIKLQIYLDKKLIQDFSVPTSLLVSKCMGNFNQNVISSVPGFFISL